MSSLAAARPSAEGRTTVFGSATVTSIARLARKNATSVAIRRNATVASSTHPQPPATHCTQACDLATSRMASDGGTMTAATASASRASGTTGRARIHRSARSVQVTARS